MQASRFTDLFKAVGFSDAQADTLVGVFTQIVATQRVFDYQRQFPPTDPDCVSTFARSFQHQDWVDGESVVQAEQTSIEDGFNVRFHRIEQDLDALGANVAKAFLCLGEMRGDLRAILDEIKLELNRVNSDLFALKDGTGRPPPLPLPTHNLHDIVINEHDVGTVHLVVDDTHAIVETHAVAHEDPGTHLVVHDIVNTHSVIHDIGHLPHGL
jgi:hypothetical protein